MNYQTILSELEASGNLRRLPEVTHEGRWIEREGQRMLNLSSNDYLGLATRSDLQAEFLASEAVRRWPLSSSSSRLLTGNFTVYTALEQRIARDFGREAALLFNSGYHANTGILPALADKQTLILADKLVHASLIDGIRLGEAPFSRYRHNDYAQLERLLAKNASIYETIIVVTESVFSMDGDIVDVPKLVALGKKYHLLTMIDEAHATGVIGATGKGAVEHFGNSCTPDIIMGTLSKSLGAEGGFACSSRVIIEYLKNKARSFIFATAQTPATLGAALAALHILESEPQRAQALQHNAEYFINCLQQEGVKAQSPTAIIPIIIGDEATALKVAEELLDQSILVPAIRYPTVAKGTARLRVALMSSHTEAELANTAKLIAAAIKKYQ